MIPIGERQSLKLHREMPQGIYLADDDGEEVLLPRNYVTETMVIGDPITVFVYLDGEGLPVATTDEPMVTAGEFALLRVADVNRIGAFFEWGIVNQLMVPFSNQAAPLRVGSQHVVYCYVDDKTGRLVGSTKLDRFLAGVADDKLAMGQAVDLLFWKRTDLGYHVIIDNRYVGMVYPNEWHRTLQAGHRCPGYIKPIREDGKIDLSLTPIGHESIEPNAAKILAKLEDNDGFLPFTDRSSPEMIRDAFGISKKLFKKALGSLYKRKLVRLETDGIYRIVPETQETGAT